MSAISITFPVGLFGLQTDDEPRLGEGGDKGIHVVAEAGGRALQRDSTMRPRGLRADVGRQARSTGITASLPARRNVRKSASITSVEPAVTSTWDGSTPCRAASASFSGGVGGGERFASRNASASAARTRGEGGSVFSFDARRMRDGRRLPPRDGRGTPRSRGVCAPRGRKTRRARSCPPSSPGYLRELDGRPPSRSERSHASAVASVSRASRGAQKTRPGSPALTASTNRATDRSNGCTVIVLLTRRRRPARERERRVELDPQVAAGARTSSE